MRLFLPQNPVTFVHLGSSKENRANSQILTAYLTSIGRLAFNRFQRDVHTDVHHVLSSVEPVVVQ